jgi:ribonuclease Z
MIDFYAIPVSQILNIKNGQDYVQPDGKVVPNERLIVPAAPPRSYAYVSDTKYKPQLTAQLQNVTTLYHESTYGDDNLAMSEKYFHSTARQAAQIALGANVGKLLLGHYSSRYTDEKVLLEQAKEVFPITRLTKEFDVIDI